MITLLIAGSLLFLALLASAAISVPSLIEETAAAMVGVPFAIGEAKRHRPDS